MIYHYHEFPRYFMILTSLLIGPSTRFFLPVGLVVVGLAAVFLVLLGRRSFSGQTVTLLGILGIMVLQSLMILGHFIGDPNLSPAHDLDEPWRSFSIIFGFNLGVSLVGVIAASGVAIFIELVQTRMNMTRAFPQVDFLEAPDSLKNTVETLARKAGINTPKIWLVDSGIPAAFTVRADRQY
jgi:hypothetical protein